MRNLRLVWLVLLTICCVGSGLAQEKSYKIDNECDNYGKPGFVGRTISLEFVNVDLKELLAYYNQNFGCNFVVDKVVRAEQITVNIKDIPWNIVLDSILRSKNLGIQKNGPILRIADSLQLDKESTMIIISCPIADTKADLETEQIKLKHIPNQTSVNIENLLKVLKRRNTNRGTVEFEKDSNTLKVTDVRANLDVIKKLIEIIDVEVNLNEYLIQKKKQEEAIKNNYCLRSSNK